MKTTFGVIVTSRGIFPGHLIEGAKKQLFSLLEKHDMDYVILPADATRQGFVHAQTARR